MTKSKNQDDLVSQLKERISELESELRDREQDLKSFHQQMIATNEQLEDMITQLEGEIGVVAAIQKRLVPTEFPNIPGFEFSTKFVHGLASGGDYFDIFEHENRFRYGIVLASSSGYTTSALLLSVLLKFMGQIEAKKGVNPDLILQMISKEMTESMSNNDFAHLFYGTVDRKSFELSYSMAGDVRALLFVNQNKELRSLRQDQPSFSKQSNFNYQKSTVSLNPRDRLILCSYGVVESVNPKGEKFGVERLYDVILSSSKLGAHELRNDILYNVEKFRQAEVQKKDITIIVAEVKDHVIKLAKPYSS